MGKNFICELTEIKFEGYTFNSILSQNYNRTSSFLERTKTPSGDASDIRYSIPKYHLRFR